MHSAIKLQPLTTTITRRVWPRIKRWMSVTNKPIKVIILGEFVSDVIANYSEYSMLAILIFVIFSFWHVVVSVN